jgi:hypothetical protein
MFFSSTMATTIRRQSRFRARAADLFSIFETEVPTAALAASPVSPLPRPRHFDTARRLRTGVRWETLEEHLGFIQARLDDLKKEGLHDMAILIEAKLVDFEKEFDPSNKELTFLYERRLRAVRTSCVQLLSVVDTLNSF